MKALRILHLYPRELGINGDVGNVTALVRRCEWRGLKTEVINHAPEGVLPDDVDVVHIGSGPTSAQRAVHPDIVAVAPRLRSWQEAGVPFLAIAGGWQLLGSELELADGTVLAGAGVLPSRARLSEERAVGEIIGVDRDGLPIAGFENHSSVTTLLDGAKPLMEVSKGYGNAGRSEVKEKSMEGVRSGASIGTNLHGPFLPLNPRFADFLLTAALARHGLVLPESDGRAAVVDEYASNAREAIVSRVGR